MSVRSSHRTRSNEFGCEIFGQLRRDNSPCRVLYPIRADVRFAPIAVVRAPIFGFPKAYARILAAGRPRWLEAEIYHTPADQYRPFIQRP